VLEQLHIADYFIEDYEFVMGHESLSSPLYLLHLCLISIQDLESLMLELPHILLIHFVIAIRAAEIP
jgi:hypothetical protein